ADRWGSAPDCAVPRDRQTLVSTGAALGEGDAPAEPRGTLRAQPVLRLGRSLVLPQSGSGVDERRSRSNMYPWASAHGCGPTASGSRESGDSKEIESYRPL